MSERAAKLIRKYATLLKMPKRKVRALYLRLGHAQRGDSLAQMRSTLESVRERK